MAMCERDDIAGFPVGKKTRLGTVVYKLKREIKKRQTLHQILLPFYLLIKQIYQLIRSEGRAYDKFKLLFREKQIFYKFIQSLMRIIIVSVDLIINIFLILRFLIRISFSKNKANTIIDKNISTADQWFIDHVEPIIFRTCSKVALNFHLFINVFRKKHEKRTSVLHISLITTKAYMLSRLLRKHGLESAFFAMNADIAERLNIGYDYHIPYSVQIRDRRWHELYYLWAVLARYDVIHFHFNTLLSLDNGWEISYLKRLNKVLVFHFRGCDLRQKSINMTVNPELNCCIGCDYAAGSCDTDYQRGRIMKAKQSGDLFFVTTPDLRDFFPEAEHIPFISPFGIDLDQIQPAEKREEVFRVVTSSNHPGIDGVPYVRDAVARLASEGYPIELLEVIQLPFFQALSVYKSADLFAGKLTMGYYNNANIETMMMGIPNMSYIRDEYLHKIPDCPIIIARPDNIYEKMKEWIQKPEELKKVGAKGPLFVKKYHDPDVVIDHMIRRYNEAFIKKTGCREH